MAKKKKFITETVEEYLARGGEITRVSPEMKPKESHTMRPSVVGPPTLYSLDEAQHFFGNKKVKAKPKEAEIDFSSIDRSKIPSSLHHILERKNGNK